MSETPKTPLLASADTRTLGPWRVRVGFTSARQATWVCTWTMSSAAAWTPPWCAPQPPCRPGGGAGHRAVLLPEPGARRADCLPGGLRGEVLRPRRPRGAYL